MGTLQKTFVSALRLEAKGILSVELQPLEGKSLAPFEAGAYIDVHLPNQLVRSYSLLNSPDEKDRYVIGVLHDLHSRGGSDYIHKVMRVGDELEISSPSNNFQLNEHAKHTVLVAGGIGITPLYCMLNHLVKLGRSVELIYCTGSRAEAVYLDRLEKLNAKITCHFDDEQGHIPPLEQYLAGYSHDTHFYCCGPVGMLKAFEAACKKFNYSNTHIELFSINNLIVAETALSDADL